MNYLKIYQQLVDKRMNDPASKYGYHEKHHIIPRCMGGSNDTNNIVTLTAREHFIAHCLLYEIYKDEFVSTKLYKAVTMMKADKSKSRYFNGRIFEQIRVSAMEKYKISDESEYYRSEHYKITMFNKRTDKSYAMPLEDRIDTEYRSCLCGCGETFLCKISSERVYLNISHSLSNRSEDVRNSVSLKIKDYISNLGVDDKAKRLANSLGKSDPIKRAELISKAKKGVSTNQPLIEEFKYGNMTECEFNEYIKGRKEFIIKRMSNRRMKYNENVKNGNVDIYKDFMNE